jgi:hypothetical protein
MGSETKEKKQAAPATKKAAAGTAKKKPAATKKKPAPKEPETLALPAIEAAPFSLKIIDGGVERSFEKRADEITIMPPTWFAVALTAPVEKRYLHLIQMEKDSRKLVIFLLADRTALGAGDAVRLPAQGAWLRAIVEGTIHVLVADVGLSRAQIVKALGGHQPPPTQAMPPYT